MFRSQRGASFHGNAGLHKLRLDGLRAHPTPPRKTKRIPKIKQWFYFKQINELWFLSKNQTPTRHRYCGRITSFTHFRLYAIAIAIAIGIAIGIRLH
jgi:hypothetical protein